MLTEKKVILKDTVTPVPSFAKFRSEEELPRCQISRAPFTVGTFVN